MAELADKLLLDRFQKGDRSALDTLLSRYETPLFQFLLGMLRDHHEAEDALQNTFIRALERLDGVDGEHLRGWLFTVAYHQAQLARRKRKSGAQVCLANLDPQSAESEPSHIATQSDDTMRLRGLLEQLPASQREVIHLRIFEEKRFREIAATLGCPLNTALSRLYQGLKTLRLLWGTDHV